MFKTKIELNWTIIYSRFYNMITIKNYLIKKVRQDVGIALLYIKCRVGHCNGSVKYESNDISLVQKNTNNDSEWRWSIS